jgi:hypothetical protein
MSSFWNWNPEFGGEGTVMIPLPLFMIIGALQGPEVIALYVHWNWMLLWNQHSCNCNASLTKVHTRFPLLFLWSGETSLAFETKNIPKYIKDLERPRISKQIHGGPIHKILNLPVASPSFTVPWHRPTTRRHPSTKTGARSTPRSISTPHKRRQALKKPQQPAPGTPETHHNRWKIIGRRLVRGRGGKETRRRLPTNRWSEQPPAAAAAATDTVGSTTIGDEAHPLTKE